MKISAASSKTLLSNAALGVVGVALVSTMVVRASSAAFTGTTENAANNWDAGTVTLTNNKGAALFNAQLLKPGNTGEQCIEVTYTGSIMPGEAIKIHGLVTDTDAPGAGHTGTQGQLSDDLDMVVNRYAAGETCDLTATPNPTKTAIFTNTLNNLPATYGAGTTTGWTPAATNEVRAFSIKYTLGTDTANDAQGDIATAKFVWEASSLNAS